MFDSLIKVMYFFGQVFICWALVYISAPYNPNNPKAKYITITSNTAAMFLIPKHNIWQKRVKANNRNKLSLHSLIGYIILTVILLVSIVMVMLPPMPCEPDTLPYSRHSQITVTTYNEKIPLSLILVFQLVVLLSFIIPAFIHSFSKKAQPVDKGSKIVVLFVIILFLFMAGYHLINLI